MKKVHGSAECDRVREHESVSSQLIDGVGASDVCGWEEGAAVHIAPPAPQHSAPAYTRS